MKRYLHKKCIMKVKVVNTKDIPEPETVPFCVSYLDTNRGVFKFSFTEDTGTLFNWKLFFMASYTVHLEPPEGLISTGVDLNSKIVLAIKVMLFEVDYDILVSILVDLYLDRILKLYKNGET